MTTLQDIGQTREDMGCECKNLMEAFGDSFQYEDTDFQNISMVLDTYANLLEAIRLVSDMMEIVQDFDPADSELAEELILPGNSCCLHCKKLQIFARKFETR